MELKHKYNQVLERYNNAVRFLDDEDKDWAYRISWEEEYRDVMLELNDILDELEGQYTESEVLGGMLV